MNQMLAVLLPTLLNLQQNMRGPCRPHPSMCYLVHLSFPQMTEAKIAYNIGIWLLFGSVSLSSTFRVTLRLRENAWNKFWGSKWFQNCLTSRIVPSSPWFPLVNENGSNIKQQGYLQLLSLLEADPGKGREHCSAHSRYRHMYFVVLPSQQTWELSLLSTGSLDEV